MRGIAKKLFIVAFIVSIGAAGTAMAHGGFGGNGYGHMMGPGYGPGMMGPGYGGHMMGPGMMGYGPHMGWWGGSGDRGITSEQAEKLENARESFYTETRDLREKLYDRSAELRRELSRENPDRSKVQDLQKDLSELEGELDQKRLAHRLEVRKIAPQFGGDIARGGYGPGAGWCWQ